VATPRAARLRLPGIAAAASTCSRSACSSRDARRRARPRGYTLTDWGLREGVLLEAVGVQR
jgi:hypothetical protein